MKRTTLRNGRNGFPLRLVLTLFMACVVTLSAGCVHLPPGAGEHKGAEVAAAVNVGSCPADQLLVVLAERQETSRARLYLMERGSNGWEVRRGPLPAMVGRNGFAPPGEKREGDGRTPTGLFSLEFVFGYALSTITEMPYRQATENDIWVDDVTSPDYNTWGKKGETTAASFEEMKLADQRYRHGIVIGYNRNPIIAGLGSAIFIHAWLEEGTTTAGCVALDEAELIRIIRWLDPAKSPMILMGKRADLATMPGLSGLATADRPAVLDDMEKQMTSMISGASGRLVEYGAAEGFYGMAVAVPESVEDEILTKKSWHEGCPVPLSDLSYLVLSYWGFDDKPHIGELVVHRKLALPTIKAFADLYRQRFPIERMELIERYDASDDRSMAANNTSAFNCRDVTGRPGVFSKHSYGAAIDINPVQNPYVAPKSDVLKALGWNGAEDKAEFLGKLGYPHDGTVARYCGQDISKCLVLPPNSLPFLDRTTAEPGILVSGPAVEAFTSRGFEWGGWWRNSLDYQHIQVNPERLR